LPPDWSIPPPPTSSPISPVALTLPGIDTGSPRFELVAILPVLLLG
jgi:hypothetical protein